MKCPNTVPYRGQINRQSREKLLNQKSMVLWFTGLSGSGKSTIAQADAGMNHVIYIFEKKS